MGTFEYPPWYPHGRAGHPAQGGPWYGVVSVHKIMYRVHMVCSMHDSDLFRLNTDVWLEVDYCRPVRVCSCCR